MAENQVPLDVDLGQIATFYAVHTSGGVVAASKQLHRSQPAISMRIKQLEKTLGLQLFEKVGRSLQLTPAGEAILPEVEAILHAMQRLKDKVLSYRDAPSGVLKVGALQALCVYLLPTYLTQFQGLHPGVEFHFDLDWVPHLLERLKQGLLDCCFVVGDVPEDDYLHCEILGEVRAVAVFSKSLGLSGRRVLSITELRKQKMISYGVTDDPFFKAISDFVRQQGLGDNIQMTLPSIDSIKSFLQSGEGVAILPHYTVVEPNLCTLPVEKLSVTVPFWLGLRKSSLLMPLLSDFYQHIQTSFSEPWS